jgi:hypothetical protein
MLPPLEASPFLASSGDELPQNPIPEDLSFLMGEQVPGMGETYEVGPDGLMSLVTLEDDYLPAVASGTHTENLAEVVDESELGKIANRLIDLIEDDIESRKPWAERYRRGLEMMGLIPDEIDDGPFPGASTAVMPIISEAAVQFWARSLAEQVPSDGPVKGKVMGKANIALQQKADRVATYMNHDVMFLDRSWYADHSRLLFALPLGGSCFKKMYRDNNNGRNVSEYVSAEDFICNYQFNHLDNAPRYTHRIWRSANEIRKSVVSGVYRDVEMGDPPHEELSEQTSINIEAQDFDVGVEAPEDARYELYECYCELDLPDFEELDERGEPTGVALPYIVTIDKHSEKILSIYRHWKENDPLKRRRTNFIKYDMVPGVGFYGLGFFHLIGGLQLASTGAMRAVLDGAAMASLQGGFISKDASLKDQRITVEPGVWKQLDATAEDLNKAFVTPPFKEPSPVLFQIIGFLVQRAEKFTATTELMTGGQDTKGAPVGSTQAAIEQGGKVFSTVHRGLHRSLAEELRIRFEMIQEYMPTEGYPWDVDGAHEGIMQEDFAPGVSILPVSDPNIFTQAQRIAQAQAIYDLSQQNPDLIKRPVALRRVLEALNVPDIDELMPSEQGPPPPMDPISEIQALLRGEPVQAYPDQHHVAYLQHYAAFMQNPQFGANKQVAEQIGPAATALIGQRLAYAWATHARALGAPAPMLPPPGGDPSQQDPQNPAGALATQAPPELIAQVAAQIAPQMAQVPGLPSPEAEAANVDAEVKQQELQLKMADADMKRQDQAFKMQAAQVDQQGKAQELAVKQAELEMKRQEAERKLQMEQMKAEQEAQLKAQELAMKQAEAEQKRIIAEQKAMQDAALAGQKMQQDREAHQRAMMQEEERAATERQMATIKAALMAKESEKNQQLAEAEAMRVSAETQRLSIDTQGQAETLASLSEMIGGIHHSMTSPKRIIRGPDGKAIGVENVISSKPSSSKSKKKDT